MAATTSVQITRESSDMLSQAADRSGLAKSYLADIAIRYFFDTEHNPNLENALKGLSSGRKQAEVDFIKRIFDNQTAGT